MGSSNGMLGNFGKAAGYGSLGGGLAGMFFNGGNPAHDAMGQLNQIPGAISPYLSPYFNAGTGVLPQLGNQFNRLATNPGARMNAIGQNFQQSPGFQFSLQQALQGADHAAAAGGMAGSPQHEQQNMQIATQMGNQDYYNWLHDALGLYGTGLSGEQNMAQMGMGAGQSLADQIAQMLSAKSQLSYAGKANQNESTGGAFGNILGGLGSLAAFGGL